MFSIHNDEMSSVPLRRGELHENSRPMRTLPRNVDDGKPKYSQRRKSRIVLTHPFDDQSLRDYKKKIEHREVERKRREQMTSLYQSLRSLLPDQFLKGKGSTSDQIDGAVEYIKYLNQRLDKLKNKKNELKEWPNLASFRSASECLYSQEKSSVTISHSSSGMEVTLSTCLRGGLPLSELLKVLNKEGMSIRSCNSVKINQRRLHIVDFDVPYEVTQVDEAINVYQGKLQEKLQDLVCNLH